MKAVHILEDNSLAWLDAPEPVCAEDGVVIDIYAAGINRADLLQRAGNYPPPAGSPPWMGLEVAGVVAEAGAKSGRKVGDRVAALLGGGGYAERVAIRGDQTMLVPDGFALERAAGMVEIFCTSWLKLVAVGGLTAGQTLLVTGGTSGLATAMIPMAKALGARVLTTVRGAEKAAAIASLGADRVIDTDREDLAEVMAAEEQAGRPVNVVVDCLGGADLGRCLPYLAFAGRWVLIATLAGVTTEVPLRFVLGKRLSILGSTLRSRTLDEKAAILRDMGAFVWPRVLDGTFRVAPKVFPIAEVETAQELMRSGVNVGKMVLRVKA